MKISNPLTIPTVLLCLTACGGGGSSRTGPPAVVSEPAAKILFPPALCHTDANVISVRGVVQDVTDLERVITDGSFPNQLDLATGEWSADVFLHMGLNEISIDIERTTGVLESGVAQCTVMRKTAILESCQDLAWSSNAEDPIIWLDGDRSPDRKLFTIEQDAVIGPDETGFTRIPVDALDLSGDAPRIAYDPDLGRLFLATSNPGRIREINLFTGDTFEYSGPTRGDGEQLGQIRDIAYSSSGLLWVLEGGNRITSVNAAGDRENQDLGGPALENLTIDDLHGQAYMNSVARVHTMNLMTGDSAVLSAHEQGSGPDFTNIKDLHYDEIANSILVADRDLGLMRVDTATGNRQETSPAGLHELGAPVHDSVRIAGCGARSQAVISSHETGGLTLINVHSGVRTPLLATNLGQGTNLELLVLEDRALRVMRHRTPLAAPIQFSYSIESTPRSGGEPSVIWSQPERILGIAEGRMKGEVLALTVEDQLLAIDLETGLSQILPDALGLDEFAIVQGIVREPDGMYRVHGISIATGKLHTALLDVETGVMCCTEAIDLSGLTVTQLHNDTTLGLFFFGRIAPGIGGALYTYDPDSNELVTLSEDATHWGPFFGRCIAGFRSGPGTAIAAGTEDALLIGVDSFNGVRHEISGTGRGLGPMPETNRHFLNSLLHVAWDEDTKVMFCLGRSSDRIFAVDSRGFGDRVILGFGDASGGRP